MSDVSLMNGTVKNETKGLHGKHATLLTLGIAPVNFSRDRVRIGRIDSEEHEIIRDLRRKHGRLRAFRFDAKDRMIANIGLRLGIEPIGDIEEVAVSKHLLLLAEAIEHRLRQWLFGSRKVLRRFHPLICLGRRDRLLTEALRTVGVQSPDTRLDVVAKWSFNLRFLSSANPDRPPHLGLLADVSTSNVIDLPVSKLLERNFDPVGYYVGTLGQR